VSRSPYTPDVGGYILAVLISLGLCALPGIALGPYVIFVVAGVIVLGVPIGLVGSVIAHLVCRRRPEQWLHVLTTGAVGFGLTCITFRFWVDGLPTPLLVLASWVAICAAAGRGSVIRRVAARQFELAVG
jgi:hypothetical protein